LSSLVELRDISKTYYLDKLVYPVLKNINLTLHQGEVTAIIGASGSGKSTLMNLIGLLDRVNSGRYLFAGEDVSQLGTDQLAAIRNQKIGFIFQSFFLLPRANALHNVMLPLLYRKMSRSKAITAAMAMLDKVGMKSLAMHLPHQLSGGQQQRVAIARALVTKPQLILADEPTGALDSSNSKEIMKLLFELNHQEGCTLLIITHDEKISRLTQRVITITDGSLTLAS
jgi:putative ABC transport system ATP-binding protein